MRRLPPLPAEGDATTPTIAAAIGGGEIGSLLGFGVILMLIAAADVSTNFIILIVMATDGRPGDNPDPYSRAHGC